MGLPVEVNNLMMGAVGGYQISRSLRFRSSASAYLNRTPASAGNRRTWTWSAWVKRGSLGSAQWVFDAFQDANNFTAFFFNSDNTFGIQYVLAGTSKVLKYTTQVFRDPSAWYHIMVVTDTTPATPTFTVYVNGSQVTAFGTNTNTVSQNEQLFVNNTVAHNVGRYGGAANYFDGYLAEVNFIDGQALTPSSFGETDSITGVWNPKKYSGTYGTNGFYLPFTSGFNTTQAYAGSFSGSGQFLNVAASASLAPSTGDFTIEANVNFNALPVAGVFTGIFENQIATTSASSDKFWFGLYNSSGQYQLRIGRHNAPNGSWAVWTPTVGTWYHVAVVRQSGVISIYINGVSQTMVQATDMAHSFSQNGASFGAASNTGSPAYFNGYISNARYVVGSAVYTTGFTPPSSNLTNITNTQWLTLQNATIIDNSSAARTITNNGSVVTSNQYPFQYTLASISADYSGNNNNWTTNNINATFLGTTYDSMIDSPTPYADGNSGRGNYAVLNALNNFSIGLTGGNLDVNTTSAYAYASSTFSLPPSGKWYWEFTDTSSATLANQRCAVGFGLQGYRSSTTYVGQLSTDWFYLGTSGNLFNNASGTAYGATYTQNDVVGIAIDCATGKFWFSKNGTFQASGDPVVGTGQAGTLSGDVTTYTAMVGNLANSAGLSCVGSTNFGQRPFSYTPPSGFKALNSYNLPAASISNGAKHFAATTYTGNGTSQSIVNNGSFQPDFVWMKSRSNAYNNILQDSIRGAGKNLQSNTTNAETGNSGDLVSSFNSNGFTVNNTYLGGSDASTNGSGATYIGWQWKGGGTAVTNNSGTISSQVSANTSAGFSIVTFTGNAVNGATVGHGLGVTPAMLFVKNRSIGASSWIGWHKSISQSIQTSTTFQLTGYTGAIFLNLTNGSSTYGYDQQINGNGNSFVAYCWSEVAGFSAFGKYTGNGSSDGPFIFTNMRPRWLLIKNSSNGTVYWNLIDTSRSPYNVADKYLCPNASDAEATYGGWDILSNGFKIRNTGGSLNNNGDTYIYAAFAENPFNISRAR